MSTPKNQSVFKAFSMLRSFHNAEEWLTGCELSRRANLPNASGHRLIQTLEEIGAVVRGPRGRYRPGLLLVSLARNVVIGELLREASRSLTASLARRFDVTVQIAMLESGMVSYVAKASTPTSFPTCAKLGTQHEAYCSSLGKVLLAALPPAELEAFIMDGDLIALTPYTVTNRAALRAQLKEVHSQGFAIDDREFQNDMWCMAVPIHDGDGFTVAAMAVIDNADRMTPSRQTDVNYALCEAAASLGLKLSGHPSGERPDSVISDRRAAPKEPPIISYSIA